MSSILPQEWLIPKPANDKSAWATPKVTLDSFTKAVPTIIPMPSDGGVFSGYSSNTGPVSRGFTAVNPTGSPQKFTDYRDTTGHSGGGNWTGGARRFGGPDEFGLGGYVDPAKTSDRIKALFDGLENDEDVPKVRRKKGRKGGRKAKKEWSEEGEEEGKVDEELAEIIGKTALEEGVRESQGGYYTAPEGEWEEQGGGVEEEIVIEGKERRVGAPDEDAEEVEAEEGEEEEEEEEEDEEEDEDESVVPGMNVTLLPHQIRGLRFLRNREEGKNRGGLLCDDVCQSL